MTETHIVEVQARIPPALAGLEVLAGNLLYAWDRQVRGLFWHMDAELWECCGHNPKVFLRRISQRRLDQLAADEAFLEEYRYALALLRGYNERTRRLNAQLGGRIEPVADLVAYFCAEYGLHESLPVYSGGLGILAGDHLKAASSLGLPFVAVGLMYHQGYFIQRIDAAGDQQALFTPHQLRDLPIAPVFNDNNQPLTVGVPMAGREVAVRVWRAEVGQLHLYLLDTDVPANSAADRAITYQLYGGDQALRLAQELVLGVGGVRALRALNLQPAAWHINEGHAAFLIIERCREAVAAGLSFQAALEQVAAATVFTTHTPVSAGHDLFAHDLAAPNLRPYAEALGIDLERLLSLGTSPEHHHRFNMTALGLRGSRFHNGVSRIHGRVSSQMEQHIWPQIPPEENPISHVTNGVHVETFLARQWANLLDMRAPGWHAQLSDTDFWREAVNRITDQSFWANHLALKQELLEYVRNSLLRQYRRNGLGEAHIERRLAGLRAIGTRPLVIGFARRFATYKRATLLLHDLGRLERLLNNPDRPVILLYAGKAHPADKPGQASIRELCSLSRKAPFAGKLFVLENYDLALSRKLVTGVDVWLNTPIAPLEACGTSGQKAGMNGALNVSVLDGWWGEAYSGENGWAITPRESEDAAERDANDAEDLYDILEDEVIPLYYELGELGYSRGWVKRCKAAMSSIIPRFNAQRMVLDYVDKLYRPALALGRRLADADNAQALAAWKDRVADSWPRVRLQRMATSSTNLQSGDKLEIIVQADLDGLGADGVQIECVFSTLDGDDNPRETRCYQLRPTDEQGGATVFSLELPIEEPGRYGYRIRAYPAHPDLAHPFEAGLMQWL